MKRKMLTGIIVSLVVLNGCNQNRHSLPNIIIIMADDMGYFDPGCYGSGIHTPNVDRLAREGILFSDFYSAAPNCSPARAGLLTGRTPSRTGVYDWIPPESPMHLPSGEITIAEILKEEGYSTCHVGKWHLGTWGNHPLVLDPSPGDQGFDHWLAVDNNALPSHLDPVNFIRNGEPLGQLEGYSCQIVIDEGIRWLRGREDQSRPFYLNVWFNEPHKKLASPPELIDNHGNLEASEALYYANIENLDLAVGRLLTELDNSGLSDNTLVLFTSDNGPWRTASAGKFRGKKSSLYEGGIREPGIIRWPGKVKPGSVTGTPAGFVDILPTLCEISGAPLPAGIHYDGTSILPLLLGEEIERHQPLFWFFYKSSPAAVIRKGNYVLTADPLERYRSELHKFDRTDQAYLKNLSLEVFQLFDLENDVEQLYDLSDSLPGETEELKSILLNKFIQMIDEGVMWTGLHEPISPESDD